MAGLRLGMTLGEARRVIPGSRLERTSDGDGAALVAVRVDTSEIVILHAGEDDPEGPINWSQVISSMQTFHASCRTTSGIHPGALVTDVARILGPVVSIVEREIESRQYVSFERQPTWFTLRLDYTGVFADGSRETTSHQPGARILAISISRHN